MPKSFLITPFTPERAGGESPDTFDAVRAAVEAGASDAGVELVLPDRKFEAGDIMDQVRREIHDADVVLAVITGLNPNVFYELGLASRPALLIGADDDLPFDVRHMRCLTYAGEGELETLAQRVEQGIRQTLETAGDPDETLRDYFRALRAHATRFPYVSLSGVRGGLEDVYVSARLQPQGTVEVVSISDVLGKDRHVLITGGPGSGKSTLLRHLASHAWDQPGDVGLRQPHIPMLVPLQLLARAHSAVIGERLWDALGKSGELALMNAPRTDYFTEWPRRMRAPWLLLLDGLDQVATDGRRKLIPWLLDLLDSIDSRSHRVVVTSRPPHPAELGERLAVHSVLPFGENEREKLADSYLGERTRRFLQEFERLRGTNLRGNPLLLTIAATVYDSTGHLPESQSSLYGRYLESLLKEARQLGLVDELGDDVADAAMPVLEHLAWEMAGTTGMISAAAASDIVASFLAEGFDLPKLKASAAGRRFVEVMGRRSGSLLVQGDFCDWTHVAFRDYLAARRITSQGSPGELEQTLDLWKDPQYREIVTFLLDILGASGQDVSDRIRKICSSGTDGLLFGALTVGEGVQMAASLSDGIRAMLAAHVKRSGIWQVLQFPGALSLLGTPSQAAPRIELIAVFARDPEVNLWLRQNAIWALSDLDQDDELAQVMKDPDIDPKIRVFAAEELGRRHAPEVVPFLVALGQDDSTDVEVRQSVAEALEALGEEVAAAGLMRTLIRSRRLAPIYAMRLAAKLGILRREAELLDLLNDRQLSPFVRKTVVASLGELSTRPALLRLLEDRDEVVATRVAAAVAMGPEQRETAEPLVLEIIETLRSTEDLGWEESELLEAAVQALASLRALEPLEGLLCAATAESRLRVSAAKAICSFRPDHREAAGILVDVIRNDDGGLAEEASRVLAKLKRGDDLLAILRDEGADTQSRLAAARALTELEDEEGVKFLAGCEDAYLYERVEALVKLAGLGHAEDACRELVALARSGDLDEHGTQEISRGLREIRRTEDASERVLDLVRSREADPTHAVLALHSLGDWGRFGDLEALTSDESLSGQVRAGAAYQLWEAGREEVAVRALRSILTNPRTSEKDRLVAVEALGLAGQEYDLLSLVRDGELGFELRKAAVWALVPKAGAETILRVVHDAGIDVGVRSVAAFALGERECPGPLPDVVYDEELPLRIRSAAVLALGRPSGVDALRRLVAADLDPELRTSAAEMLGRVGRPDESGMALLSIVRDREAEVSVRASAIVKLHAMDLSDAYAQALSVLVEDPSVDLELRKNATGALGEARRVEELLSLARNPALDDDVRRASMAVLGAIDQNDALEGLARDAGLDEIGRGAAVKVLGERGETRRLLAMAQDDELDASTRVMAAGHYKQEEALPILHRLGCDRDVEDFYRVLAGIFLQQLEARDLAAEVLVSVADDERVGAASMNRAVEMLGKMERTDELLALARNEQAPGWARVIAASAVSELNREQEARVVFFAIVADDRQPEEIKLEILKAMGEQGDAILLPDLEGVVQSGAPETIREAAQEAIDHIRARHSSEQTRPCCATTGSRIEWN